MLINAVERKENHPGFKFTSIRPKLDIVTQEKILETAWIIFWEKSSRHWYDGKYNRKGTASSPEALLCRGTAPSMPYMASAAQQQEDRAELAKTKWRTGWRMGKFCRSRDWLTEDSSACKGLTERGWDQTVKLLMIQGRWRGNNRWITVLLTQKLGGTCWNYQV